MKCKIAERAILESFENKNTLTSYEGLLSHLEECPGCREFYKSAAEIMEFGADMADAEVPDGLKIATLEKCLEVIEHVEEAEAGSGHYHKRIPAMIAASIIIIVVATIYWVTSSAVLDAEDLAAAVPRTWALVTVIQNILMLILAPLLFKKIKKKHEPAYLIRE